MDNPENLATHGTQDEEKQGKNTPQYVLDTTMRSNVYFRLVYLLPVILDFLVLIAPSIFSNVYFRPVVCLPVAASYSGFSIFVCPFIKNGNPE
jgi:hypothetical protein